MPRTRNENGIDIPLTAEEEAARDIEDDAGIAALPMNKWKSDISRLDDGMPRWFEDAVTDGSVVLKPGRVKDNYDSKVVLRGEKP
jgi:hypothetical protein